MSEVHTSLSAIQRESGSPVHVGLPSQSSVMATSQMAVSVCKQTKEKVCQQLTQQYLHGS